MPQFGTSHMNVMEILPKAKATANKTFIVQA